MDPARWARVRDIFDAALDAPSESREALLNQLCGDDLGLLAEVRAMIRSYEGSPEFMESAEFRDKAESDALTGTTIGPYQLLRRIASGGMGSVYAAARTDHEYQKIVAIKVVKPGMDSEEILKRFRTERQVLASLEHPNIARLLDGGTTEKGGPYLVMEFVEGTPIDEYSLARELSVRQKLELFLQVAAAVQYAHQNLVIHRDLKPSNILVTNEGVPKLLDFGIAKLVKPEFSSQTLLMTRLNARPMSPDYASPEQVMGQQVTTSSDVYSLGVLLYRILTGQPPYELKTYAATEIEKTICDTDPRLPSAAVATPQIRKQLRGDLDVILLTALRKEPHRRYASVQHMADDIRRHLNGLPVNARGDSMRYRMGKFVARHTVGVVLGSLLLVTLVGAVFVSLYYANIARREKDTALQFARTMFDFDKAQRNGVTAARKDALEKVASNLDRMSPNDPEVRKLMVDAYLRIGDLQGSLYSANLGDQAASEQSYRHALKLAEASIAAVPSDAIAQRNLALASQRMGDMAAAKGDRKAAEEAYSKSEKLLASIFSSSQSSDALSDLLEMQIKIGLLETQFGDYAAALATFRAYLNLAQRLSSMDGANSRARRAVAYGYERVGELLALTGAIDEGVGQLRTAIAAYEDLLKQGPAIEARRDVATSSLILARILDGEKKSKDAEPVYNRAISILEVLSQGDSNNLQYKRDLIAALSEVGGIEGSTGRAAEGHAHTQRALSILDPLVHQPRPAVHDLHQYAWVLVTTSFRDLRNPAAALDAAKKAAERTHEKSPAVLDVLARAQAAGGDKAEAVKTETKAIALLPVGDSALRKELESNLARFSAAGQK